MEIEWSFEDYYKGTDLYYTYPEERDRVNSINHSIEELEEGAQFSFYDLALSRDENEIISKFEISKSSNVVFYLSEIEDLKEYIHYYLFKISENNYIYNVVQTITESITRIISNILGVTGYKNAEIIMRAESEKTFINSNDHDQINNKCIYWHIDKSHGEIDQTQYIENRPISGETLQKQFIISFTGERTLYAHISNQQRAEFLNRANETMFFYGHSHKDSCSGYDGISQLFVDTDIMFAAKGYGSVHIAGKNGSVHAAPVTSNESRLLFLITPI